MKQRRVRFVVVGGYALAIAGVVRATYDLDLFVDPTKANAKRLSGVFREFGYLELSRLAPRYFARPEQMAAIGRSPLQVDFITTIDGVNFSSAWRSRVEVPIAGTLVPFLGLEALLLNKRSTGRAKDRADVKALELLIRARRR